MAENEMAGDSRNGGRICSSCNNGFLPIVKHLQSLTAHGHAFHEPCIQQLFASCWNEEISYCPDSKTNVRRLNSQSIPNSCHCGETLGKRHREVKHLNERAVRKFNKRKSAVKSSGRGSKGETLRRLYRMVMRLQSKVRRIDRLQNDPKYVANEVAVERNLCDSSIGGNGGISNQCNNLQVVDPVKLSPSENEDKVVDNLKEVPSGTELILGQIGTAGRKHAVEHCNTEGNRGCKKVDFPEPVDFSPNKANTKGSDKLTEESNLMYNELALGSINTLLGDIRGKAGISNSHVNLRPGKRNIERTDNFKTEDTLGTELVLGQAGTSVEQCNIGGNIDIFNRCSKIQPAEPLKFSPSRRNSKKSDVFKAEDTPSTELLGYSIGTTTGQCSVDLGKTWKKREFENSWIFDPSKRNKKGSDTLNAGATLESGPSTTGQCSDSDDPYSIGSCIAIIKQMKDLDPFVYSAAQDLFENPNWRKIFVSLKREKRLIWLISMLPDA